MDDQDEGVDENAGPLNGVLLNGDKTLDLDKVEWRPVTHSRVPRSLRRFVLSPREKIMVLEAKKRLSDLEGCALQGDFDLEKAQEEYNALNFQVMTILTMPKREAVARARRFEAFHPCETLAGAKTGFGPSFSHYFLNH